MNQGHRHRRLEALFLECLDVPAGERASLLEARCPDDSELRAEILDLLAREGADVGRFPRIGGPGSADLASAAGDGRTAAPSAEGATPGTTEVEQIGPYRVLQRLGEGGFGEVLEAEQTTPFRRRVALKVLKPGMDSTGVLARFESERQTLAMMDHPAIARIYDAGMTRDGRPYFAMELVIGESIADYCDHRNLATRERLTLFLPVCRAVEHAHQKGVIHRDLKPSNILVGETDGIPYPRVIDFGIAKALNRGPGAHESHTRAGDLLGTPEYMSPEQAASGGLDVDTRTDVYSLGVVLYRILTGRLPLDPERLRRAGPVEVERILHEEEPLRPSEAARISRSEIEALGPMPLSSGARGGPGPSGSSPCAEGDLRGDLDWIVLRAMEKERARRYPSAAALADDLERHLRGEPVLAAAPTVAYRFRKLAHRHRAPLAAGAVVLLALVVGIATATTLAAGAAASVALLLIGLATTLRQARRARRAETDARRQAEVAAAVNTFLTRMLADANPDVNPAGIDVTLREIVDRASRQLDVQGLAAPHVEAGIRHTLGATYQGLGLYEEAGRHARRAAELRQHEYGPDAPETLECRLLAAEVTMRTAGYAAGEAAFAALTSAMGARGVPAALRERYLRLRAWNLVDLGRYDEAADHVSEAIALRRERLAGFEPNLADNLVVLSSLEMARSRFVEAKDAAREAVSLLRRSPARESASMIAALDQLARVCLKTHELAEAEALFRECVEMCNRFYGRNHRSTAILIANLALALSEAGRNHEAISHQREALAVFVRACGPESLEVASAQEGLASSLQEIGAFEEALSLRLSSLPSLRRALGDANPRLASALSNLASLYRSMGRNEEALATWTETRRMLAETYGEEHRDFAITTASLGRTYLDLGMAEESLSHIEAGLAVASRVLPARHGILGLMQGYRALALAALGRDEEAEREFLAAHDLLADVLGDGHPRTRGLAASLASFYESRGRQDEAPRYRGAGGDEPGAASSAPASGQP